MWLLWLAIPSLCIPFVNAADNQTFYDYLVAQNVSKETITFWRELTMLEGGYEKSVELGFTPSFDEFYGHTVEFYVRLSLLAHPGKFISLMQLRKHMRIFNYSIAEAAMTDVTIYGFKHLTTCLTRDSGCAMFIDTAFKKYNAFNETNELLNYIRDKYPDVEADLVRFIDEGKEQFNLLKSEFEKTIALKLVALYVTDSSAKRSSSHGTIKDCPFVALLKQLSAEELKDVLYRMLWFSRGVAKVLYDNMLKK